MSSSDFAFLGIVLGIATCLSFECVRDICRICYEEIECCCCCRNSQTKNIETPKENVYNELV